MGRGRGRGRKIVTNNGRSHQDKGSSGEEVVPARKRRGRPLKQRAAANQPELAEGILDGNAHYHHHHQGEGEGEGDADAKLKENYSQDDDSNGNKRNRVPKEVEETSNNHDMEENSSSTRSSNDESRSSGGIRLNGSRRKSTPRRAAEAGI